MMNYYDRKIEMLERMLVLIPPAVNVIMLMRPDIMKNLTLDEIQQYKHLYLKMIREKITQLTQDKFIFTNEVVVP